MKRGTNGYYHLLYKTTNLVNDRFYIGIHSTRILEDGYLGSGRRLKAEITKYGKENFKREILGYYKDRVSLAAKEKEIVNEELRNNEFCLNLTNGGDGDFTACNNSPARLIGPMIGCKKFSEYMKNPEYRQKFCKKVSESQTKEVREKIKYSRRKNTGNYNESRIGVSRSIIANEKTKQTFNQINHQQGENNSQFGTCWIYHELIGSKKCKKELLPEYIEQGWYKGRRF